jgi:alpha-N-arabinofuranosidase
MNFKVNLILLTTLFFISCSKPAVSPEQPVSGDNFNYLSVTNQITIDCTNIIGVVNRKVFGNNCLAHDPSMTTTEPWASNFQGYSDYGAGLWDPNQNGPVQNAIQLVRDAGISVLRFPGGCGSHGYNWTNAVKKGRDSFKFGLCEFYNVCSNLNADMVFTLSYFKDSPEDASNLVSFLNSTYDPIEESNFITQGKIYWPGIRAENGYTNTFNIKYFEIGNEVFHGNHKEIISVSAGDYAARYLQYYNAMKAIDPTVQIGVVLDNAQWNQIVIPAIADKVDFGILHTYPAPGYGAELEALPVDDLFLMCLGIPEIINDPFYQTTLNLLKLNAGRDIPLAITEHNGGFFMRSSIHYPFTMGNALINAELLRIFMKPTNKIIMANNWNLINEGTWGMIYNGFYNDSNQLNNPYHKRPNYYVYEMYYNHFGKYLLKADVQSYTYQKLGYTADYISVNVSVNEQTNKVYLMVINKNLHYKMITEINLKGYESSSNAQAWILNGPDYLSLNENVSVRSTNLINSVTNGLLTIELEPHSLTAIEISK